MNATADIKPNTLESLNSEPLYPEPAPELIDDIRNRLADLSPDVLERAHQALMHDRIDVAGSLLYHAGISLPSSDLYEYRKTLFPPHALLDPYNPGPPVLRNTFADGGRGEAQPHQSPVIPGSPVDQAVPTEPLPVSNSNQVLVTDNPSPLTGARHHLLQLLVARTQSLAPVKTPNPASESIAPIVPVIPIPGSNIQNPPQPSTNPTTQQSNHPIDPPPSARAGLGLEDIEPWPEPVNGAALLEELRQVLRRYVVLPAMAPETLALWVLHTYAFELRHVTTYIGLGSPQKRCGKTTLLTVLAELVNRPVVASNISPPALFRAIEEARPTLLIDEADTFLHANDEMRGILNSGYTRKTAYVVRVSDSKPRHGRTSYTSPHSTESTLNPQPSPPPSSLVRFSCWCPKIIAAIGRLPDTLLDRCIPITMQRKTPEETCERLRDLDGQTLRRKCARFVADHTPQIANARPEIPTQLNDRAADIWEPLLVIADLAGAVWPKLARDAALQMSAGTPDTTVIGSLLIDILHTFIQEDVERITSRALVDALNAFRDRPWAEARKHKQIDGLWLSQQLRPYGVRPQAMWLDGKTVKGYAKSDFEEVWPRYVSRSDFNALIADRGVQPGKSTNSQSPVPEV